MNVVKEPFVCKEYELAYWNFARKAALLWPLGQDLEIAEKEVLKVHLRKGLTIDLGSGIGRTFSHLLSLGTNVIGVDMLPEMLREAKKRTNGKIELVQCDFRRLERVFKRESFSNAICIGNSIAALFSRDDKERFFAGVRWLLRKEGVFIVDFVPAEVLRGGVTWARILSDNGKAGDGVLATFTYVLADGSEHTGAQYYWSMEEVARWLKKVGFAFQMHALPKRVAHCVAVCRKASSKSSAEHGNNSTA